MERENVYFLNFKSPFHIWKVKTGVLGVYALGRENSGDFIREALTKQEGFRWEVKSSDSCVCSGSERRPC